MTITNYKIISAVALFVLSTLSGLWLSKSGRPLNTVVFTIHKLSAVGFIVFVVMYIYNPVKVAEPNSMLTLLIITSFISIIAVVLTGASMSFEREFPEYILRLHNIFPIPAVISLSLLIYMLLDKQ